MVAKLVSPALIGLAAATVQVEADLRRGIPAFAVVGLPDAAVQESRERVRSGVSNQGFAIPRGRIVVNLAPADLRKAGPQYDLPIALSLLAASDQLARTAIDGVGAVGELALDGSLRPVTGALAMAEHAARNGWKFLVVPEVNAAEASLVPGIQIIPVSGLRHAVDVLEGGRRSPWRPVTRIGCWHERIDRLCPTWPRSGVSCPRGAPSKSRPPAVTAC